MKLFVYEHITSGALINESLPASLAHEGNNMLIALLNDLISLPDVELIILRDARLTPLVNSESYHQCLTINNDDDFQYYYNKALNDADAMLPIAPETDNTLSLILQTVLDKNKKLLASSPAASDLCGNKYHCYQYLTAHEISTPKTCMANIWSPDIVTSDTGYIVKPVDGAGCIDTLFFADTNALDTWLTAQVEVLDAMIVQPFLKGKNISLSLLCSDDDCMLLAINQQHITQQDGHLVFHGCTVNGVSESELSFSLASDIANQVYNAIDGLWGFIGIDLIVTENAILIVDINPRLTSSYAGLADSLKQNPAELLFSMIKHNQLPLATSLQRHAVEVFL